MDMAFGIEMIVGVALLFGGGAWFWSELESLKERRAARRSLLFDFLTLGAPMGMVAVGIAAVGAWILWNGIVGGPPLLDPDALRPWLPDRFNR
jgi:hypothetical protein